MLRTNEREIKLPDLLSSYQSHYPISANPHYTKASAESIAWITSTDCLGTGADSSAGTHWKRYLEKAGGALLAAYVYPFASYEKFRLSCDLMNVLFVMDEISDDQSGDDARETMERHVGVLFGGPSDGTPVSKMTASFRVNTMKYFKPNTFQRFLQSYKDYAFAVINEAASREKKQIPPVEEFRLFRRDNGGVRPCFSIIEACFDIDFPSEVIEHPTIQRIYNASLDLILWSNDLYSYKAERIRDGPTCTNIISSLMLHNKCTLQEAVDYVGVEFQMLVSQMCSDKDSLPSFGNAEVDRQVKDYIYGLEQWVIGNLRFSFDTPRYLGQERQEVERTLLVRLPVLSSSDTEESD